MLSFESFKQYKKQWQKKLELVRVWPLKRFLLAGYQYIFKSTHIHTDEAYGRPLNIDTHFVFKNTHDHKKQVLLLTK